MQLTPIIASLLIGLGLTVRFAKSQDAVEPLGLENKSVTSLSVSYGIIAVGTDRRGVYWQTEDEPSSVEWTNAGLDTLSVRTVYAHKSGPIGWAISAGVAPDKAGDPFVYCSHLGGPFEPRSDGIADSLTTRIIKMDGFPDPTICGETYAAGGRALYRRYFIDTTWTPVYTTAHDGDIHTVKVREEYPGLVLAGGGEGFSGFLLIKSKDYGKTWDNISPPTTVVSVDFSGADASTIFAAGSGSIFRSQDGGSNWDLVWDAIGAYQIAEIAYDGDSGHVYAVGRASAPDTSGVVFVSEDDGANWRQIPLNVGPVVDIALSGDWLFFATEENGMFRARKSVLVTETKTMTPYPKLEQNYPNPFSGITTIRYRLSQTSDVTISVYDLLARRVSVRQEVGTPRGSYEISFDGSRLPTGVYIYELIAGDYRDVQRMIVVR